ncbi:MAG: virulence factor [Bacillota bacterium]|nr:virulence factor [Bacillota bacterium]
MMAIAFDLDTEMLKSTYHNDSYNNAYNDIKNVLNNHGLDRMQGSVYFGDDTVDAVTCVLAVQELADEFDWFQVSVRDIRMLRIEDNNDLMPAVLKSKRKK